MMVPGFPGNCFNIATMVNSVDESKKSEACLNADGGNLKSLSSPEMKKK